MRTTRISDRPGYRASASQAALRFVVTVCLCAGLSACIVVDWEQRRWIFQPTDEVWPAGLEAARGMQDVWIDFVSDDPEHAGEPARLHGLWLPRSEPEAPLLLFLHGVRWDVRAHAPRMRHLHALGFSVLGIDYRGFGRSSALMPSETLVAEDAREAWAWLVRNHPSAPRYIFGHSLGAAVAVRLAYEVPDEAGLIVDGAFTSTIDVVRSTSWGWLPIDWLITQRFDAASRIADAGSPVLVVHGSDDTMVAPQLGRALYERARAPKRFLLIEGAVHEDTDVVGHESYRQALRELFGLGAASSRRAAAATNPAVPAAPASTPAR